jgi:hypothetical protein
MDVHVLQGPGLHFLGALASGHPRRVSKPVPCGYAVPLTGSMSGDVKSYAYFAIFKLPLLT